MDAKRIEKPRDLPPVDDVLRDQRLVAAVGVYGYPRVHRYVRFVMSDMRRQLRAEAQKSSRSQSDDTPFFYTMEDIVNETCRRLEKKSMPHIRRAINATGALLHSNLGRAPLAEVAAQAAYRAGRFYCTLEYDLEKGARGDRTEAVERLLTDLTSAESALVVNNNAAAVLLILAALARGREVIVSRGELIEIGGAFRIPEIMEESGAILREVGTTNKTRSGDYENAVNDETAAILKVNRSNFLIEGFTEDVSIEQLAAIAHPRDLPLICDLGSGCLSKKLFELIREEPLVQNALTAGADVVCFSGDKLLGGPQAGIILGKKQYLDAMRRHPLLRAFRCGKMTLAALEATLDLYFNPDRAEKEIPLLEMALMDEDALKKRVTAFAQALSDAGIPTVLRIDSSIAGCGAAPGFEMTTPVVAVDPSLALNAQSPEELLRNLRLKDPPIIARVNENRVLFDLRTVFPEEDEILLQSLRGILW